MTGRQLAAHEAVGSSRLWHLIAMEKKQLINPPHLVSHSYWVQCSIRDGDWKLIFPSQDQGRFILYDLKNDTKETTILLRITLKE